MVEPQKQALRVRVREAVRCYRNVPLPPPSPSFTLEGALLSAPPLGLCGPVFSEYLPRKYSMSESYTFQLHLNQQESTHRSLELERTILRKIF